MKALLQRCVDTLLSAVSRMGRGSRTNTQTTNNNPNINVSLTSSTHVGGRAASSSGTVSTLRPPLTSSTHVGGRAASSSGTESTLRPPLTSSTRVNSSSTASNSETVSTLHPRETAIAEHRRLFNFQPSTARNTLLNLRGSKKRRKISDKPLWNHVVICLSSTNWDHLPTFAEKAELALSGIGEKKISFPPYETFDETIYREFPNLREGGGYEVLRSSGKNLQAIPMPSGGYSVDYLKGVLAQAKCFIRPLQMDLILTEEEVCTVFTKYNKTHMF
jgi:hypothetical protein